MDKRGWARLAPLVLATMASQALLVVLGPIMVAVGADLGASVGAIGQARSVRAVVAIAVFASIANRIDTLGVSQLVAVGGVFAVAGCAAIVSAPALATFLLAHVLVGIAVACLLSAGLAGTAAFAPERRAWAIGWVAGANALAWIVVAPVVGRLRRGAHGAGAEAIPAVVALAAIVAARGADSSSNAPAAAQLRTLVAHPSRPRWPLPRSARSDSLRACALRPRARLDSFSFPTIQGR